MKMSKEPGSKTNPTDIIPSTENKVKAAPQYRTPFPFAFFK